MERVFQAMDELDDLVEMVRFKCLRYGARRPANVSRDEASCAPQAVSAATTS